MTGRTSNKNEEKVENKVKSFFELSEKRTALLNSLLALIVFLLVVFLADYIDLFFYQTFGNEKLAMISTYVLIAIILGLLYFKDLVKEFKIFVDNYDDFISPMLKYYLVGLGCMIFFNLVLSSTIGSISANEEGVREMLFKAPLLSMSIIAILAPFEEEITFRKSFQPLINNKWLYCIITAILFGAVHLRIEFVTGTFELSHLLYILPYGSLGFGLAMMNHETKSIFCSIFTHMIHNGLTALLLLAMHFMGVM